MPAQPVSLITTILDIKGYAKQEISQQVSLTSYSYCIPRIGQAERRRESDARDDL